MRIGYSYNGRPRYSSLIQNRKLYRHRCKSDLMSSKGNHSEDQKNAGKAVRTGRIRDQSHDKENMR